MDCTSFELMRRRGIRQRAGARRGLRGAGVRGAAPAHRLTGGPGQPADVRQRPQLLAVGGDGLERRPLVGTAGRRPAEDRAAIRLGDGLRVREHHRLPGCSGERTTPQVDVTPCATAQRVLTGVGAPSRTGQSEALEVTPCAARSFHRACRSGDRRSKPALPLRRSAVSSAQTLRMGTAPRGPSWPRSRERCSRPDRHRTSCPVRAGRSIAGDRHEVPTGHGPD